MRRLIWIAIVAVAVSGPALAQSIDDSPHDLGADTGLNLDTEDRICVFCHTPHNADITLSAPLWNHDMGGAATYAYYSSTTYQGGAQSITDSTQSGLCMSCHDGTVAPGALQNPPVVGTITAGTMPADGNFGTDLTNDHPVGFSYDTSDGADPSVHPTTTVEASLPLYGVTNTLECSTCHDVHDYDTISAPFLRATNASSALCLTCHIK